MCAIREHTNSIAALCIWIRKLSNSMKELSNYNMANTSAIWKNDGIKELSNSITKLSN